MPDSDRHSEDDGGATSSGETTRATAAAPLKAALWMLGTLASISLLAVAGREATRHMPTIEMMFYRSWLSLPLVVGVALVSTGGLGALVTGRLGLHAWRNGAHFAAQFAWFWAITVIPLAQVFALEFTTPLWLALLAPLVLAERLTPWRLVAVVLGFAGALVVIRPAGLAIGLGPAAALFSAVGYAFSIMAVKQLTRTDRPIAILFWMSLFQGLYATVLALPNLSLPAAGTWGWLVAVALSGLAAHYCMARAFALADTLIVAPMDYLRLPVIALVGWLAYREALDPFVLMGGAIIAGANIVNLVAERRSHHT